MAYQSNFKVGLEYDGVIFVNFSDVVPKAMFDYVWKEKQNH